MEIDLNEMKTCLAQGYPFAFAVSLFQSFSDAAQSGVVPKPGPEDTAQGTIGRSVIVLIERSKNSLLLVVVMQC